MGREIRRVPVEFNHPIQWRETRKYQPTFETMRSELLGQPSPGTTTAQTRWTYCLAPMWDKTLAEAQADWEAERKETLSDGTLDKVWTQDDLDRWEREHPTRVDDIEQIRRDLGKPIWASVEDYIGGAPDERDSTLYTPEGWPPKEERGWVVYETVSEGTPITPCFATAAELVDWLAEKGTAWDAPMSREGAERFVGSGWVPSIIVHGDVVRSGLDIAETAAR